MTDNLIEQLRGRLFEINQELDVLADDDFAAKHKLSTEADGLKQQLNDAAEASPETLRQWADRAGRKGAHTQDVEALKAMAQRSSVDGGGGA